MENIIEFLPFFFISCNELTKEESMLRSVINHSGLVHQQTGYRKGVIRRSPHLKKRSDLNNNFGRRPIFTVGSLLQITKV